MLLQKKFKTGRKSYQNHQKIKESITSKIIITKYKSNTDFVLFQLEAIPINCKKKKKRLPSTLKTNKRLWSLDRAGSSHHLLW